MNILGTFRTAVLAAAVTLTGTGVASALEVFEDFEFRGDNTLPSVTVHGDPNFDVANSDLFAFYKRYSSNDADVGTPGNHAWKMGQRAALGVGTWKDGGLDGEADDTFGALMPIPERAEFSMLFRGAPSLYTEARGIAGFGFTRATKFFNPQHGIDNVTRVAATDHYTVNLAQLTKNATPNSPGVETYFGFSSGNGLGNLNSTPENLFHTPTEHETTGVLLDPTKFYLMSATFDYDSETRLLSFTATLHEWSWGDEDTPAQKGALLLTGSSSVVLPESFGDQAQPIWWGRDIGYLDNLYVKYHVPEPGALSLMGVAGLMALRRRRMA